MSANFNDIVKGLPNAVTIATIAPNSINIGPVTQKSINEFINNNYTNQNVLTLDIFIYLQRLLDKSKDDTERKSIIETLSNCDIYAIRQDLVEGIEPLLFENIDFNCLAGQIKSVKPINFERASDDKLKQIYTYVSNPTNNITKNNFTTQQLDAFKKNKLIKNNKNLNTWINNTTIKQSTTGTDILSLEFPEETLETSEIKPKSTSTNGTTLAAAATTATAATTAALFGETPIRKKNASPVIQTSALASEIETENIPSVLAANNNNSDVNDTLRNIKEHLDRWDQYSGDNKKFVSKKTDNLTIGNNTINVECMLHFLSDDSNYLISSKKQCSRIIDEYRDKNRKLDLTSLIKLSSTSKPGSTSKLSDEKSFLKDSEFYKNLYGFNIAMADYIAKDSNITKLPIDSQQKLLSNFREFIKQSLNYLNNYMNEYNIIDDSLLSSSYNLLYLLNILTFRTANVGNNIDEINQLHAKLTQAVKDNIEIYNKIDREKLSGTGAVLGTSNQITQEINAVTQRLQEKIAVLDKQRTILQDNVNKINENSANLKDLISGDVKKIAEKITDRIYVK